VYWIFPPILKFVDKVFDDGRNYNSKTSEYRIVVDSSIAKSRYEYPFIIIGRSKPL